MLVDHCEMVKELMDCLEFLYYGKGNISRIYDVWQSIYPTDKGGKSLITHFIEFKKLY